MQEPADMVVRPAIKQMPRSAVRDAHQRIVRCGLGIVAVSSETEDKFEDAMEVTASSPLPEIARVLVRFNHHANFIIKHVHKSSMTSWPDRLVIRRSKTHPARSCEPGRAIQSGQFVEDGAL